MQSTLVPMPCQVVTAPRKSVWTSAHIWPKSAAASSMRRRTTELVRHGREDVAEQQQGASFWSPAEGPGHAIGTVKASVARNLNAAGRSARVRDRAGLQVTR